MKKRLPWIWTGFVAVASVVLLLTGGYDTDGFGSLFGAAGWLMLPILFTGLGALILTRIPGNRIAWLLLVVGVGVLLDGTASRLSNQRPHHRLHWTT